MAQMAVAMGRTHFGADHAKGAVFDFEDMVCGWPVQDIGTALYYLWSRDDFYQMWDAFRTGYSTVVPWPDRGGEVAS